MLVENETGTSLVVQRIRLCAPNAGGPGLIPGQGTRSHMHATTEEPACCNKGAGEPQLRPSGRKEGRKGGGRKEGRKEGREEGRREGRKGGRREEGRKGGREGENETALCLEPTGSHFNPSPTSSQPPVSAVGSRWRVSSPNTSPLPSHPVRNCLGVPCTQLSPHLLVSRLPPSCWPGLLYVPRVSRAQSRCLPFACAVPSFWNSFPRLFPVTSLRLQVVSLHFLPLMCKPFHPRPLGHITLLILHSTRYYQGILLISSPVYCLSSK